MTLPTSGDIRPARTRAARVWAPRIDVAREPLLAALGVAGTAARAVAGPLLPIADRVGLAPVAEVVDAAAPPPVHGEIVAPVRPADPASGSGWPAGGVPASLRAGMYGEMAWRGWHMMHCLERQPQVARVARTFGRFATRWTVRFESVADELFGQLLTRTHRDEAPSSNR